MQLYRCMAPAHRLCSGMGGDERAGPPTSPGTGAKAKVPFRLAVILGALTAVGPLSVDMYLPALPQLARDLSAGPVPAQLTLTAWVAGLAVGQIVAGPMSDLWGRRRPLLIGLAAYAAAS